VNVKAFFSVLACECGLGGVLFSNPTLAQEAVSEPPVPHWSHLPIWGVDAEARGFQLPLPFGFGFNYYREQQPFNIHDLQVSRGGRPVSVNDFLGLKQVETTQRNGVGRLDAWLFPFLSVYGLVGYTAGHMEGQLFLPDIPKLNIPSQVLPLNIGYEGPTYGGGCTLAGGFKVSEWRGLTLFAVLDVNYTVTDL
jgi:hypothetical protein